MSTTDRSPARRRGETAKKETTHYVTIPAHRSLIAIGEVGAGVTQCWEAGDEDIPAELRDVKPQEMQFVRDFVRRVILNDPKWGAAVESLYLAMDLRGLFYQVEPGDEIPVPEEAYQKLVEVVRSPTRPYNTALMVLMGEWLDAILEAPTSPREDAKANGKVEDVRQSHA